MSNEVLLALSFLVVYGGVLLSYRFFGKDGLTAFNVFATIVANIEVLILVRAFGVEMTLGNVLFGSTYLITDIIHENHGRKEADRAVLTATFASVMMLAISQLWLRFTPSENDFTSDAFHTIFQCTPRIVAASLAVYLVTQLGDVRLYSIWWKWCNKRFGDSRKGLWIRNNGSTLISQLFNTVLYSLLAFWGTYPKETLVQICISTYLIYAVICVLNTPLAYLCRSINDRKDNS